MTRISDRFDDSYYRRFYGAGGAHDMDRISNLATAVHHFAAWWGVEVSSVLDVGSGVGMWRDWYRTNHPNVRITSIDISDHACATWGHVKRDISSWTPRTPVDLVVCHSVLQYLDDERASSAIGNLATATRHLLYLEIPTSKDFRTIVDPVATDMDVHRRSGDWYRRRLLLTFHQVGAGLWVKQDSIPMYELEAAKVSSPSTSRRS